MWYSEGGTSNIIISRDVVFRESVMFMTNGGVVSGQTTQKDKGPELVELEL